jgi:hypothetical protein
MGKHDLSYRVLFSQPRMVEELLRGFVGESWIERLDFSTLERVNASYVAKSAEGLKNREGDVVWKLRQWEGSFVYVYILLEFQSTVDRFMAVRLMVYLGLLYQDLIARGELTPSGKLPTVLPLVLYNGEELWWAALELSELIERLPREAEAYLPRLRYRVIDEGSYQIEELDERRSAVAELFRLEKSRQRSEMKRGFSRLVEFLKGPGDGGLRRAFMIWINSVLRSRWKEEEIPDVLGLEEFRDMLEKRVQEWNRELREEGRQEGRQEGGFEILVGLLEQRFGPVDAGTRSRLRSADPEQILAWSKRLLSARCLEDVFGDETH